MIDIIVLYCCFRTDGIATKHIGSDALVWVGKQGSPDSAASCRALPDRAGGTHPCVDCCRARLNSSNLTVRVWRHPICPGDRKPVPEGHGPPRNQATGWKQSPGERRQFWSRRFSAGKTPFHSAPKLTPAAAQSRSASARCSADIVLAGPALPPSGTARDTSSRRLP